MASLPSQDDRVLSVGELTRAIKETLNDAFPGVWVRGEVSGLKRPDSGHLYFNLKEGTTAVIACAMWRNAAMKLGFPLRDGGEVEAYGEIDVYAPRGGYQLIIKQLRPAGLGALLLQLEELKRRLASEGLFATERKRPLPQYPRRIGMVTSPVGAAVRDIVKVLRGRWPGIAVVLAPVKVQGEGAANEIAAAIERFNRYGHVDLLIVGRGGGSMEDLWAFNEEVVVRAIAGSTIPVISAVGHEVDTTLADLAADVRAATPSNAAEIAVRDARELMHRVRTLEDRVGRSVRGALTQRRRVLGALLGQYGFRRVRDVFTALQQRVDDLRERIDAAVRAELDVRRDRIGSLTRAYGLREYPRALAKRRECVVAMAQRLESSTVSTVLDAKRRVNAFGDRLRALSPRLVLERGYTLVRTDDGQLVRGLDALKPGDHVTIEFARGDAVAAIETIRKGGA